IINQIRDIRKQPGGDGNILWNMRSLARNQQFEDTLVREVYQQPALVPAAPWLGRSHPAKPTLATGPQSAGRPLSISWTPAEPGKNSVWVLQTRIAGNWNTEILSGSQTSRTFKGPPPDAIAVTAVDRNGNASSPAVVATR